VLVAYGGENGFESDNWPQFLHPFISVDGGGKSGEDDDRAGRCHLQRVAREREHRGISFGCSNPCLSLNRSLAPRSKSRCEISHMPRAPRCHFFRFVPFAETAPHPTYLCALYGGECDEANGKEEASMPDPKECRRYALECVWLAQVP